MEPCWCICLQLPLTMTYARTDQRMLELKISRRLDFYWSLLRLPHRSIAANMDYVTDKFPLCSLFRGKQEKIATRTATMTSSRLSLLLFLLLSIAGVQGCSYFCEESSQTIGNSLLRSELAVRAYIGEDISPPPLNPYLPFDTKIYKGRIKEVFKGHDDISRGKVVFAGGPCGSGYQEDTEVLLFGSLREMTVKGFATPIPVFVPTTCAPSPNFNSLDETKVKRLQEYASSSQNPCVPEDCAGSEVLTVLTQCPDRTHDAGSSRCEVSGGRCVWIPPPCP